ncbi:MAG: hypothetical protein JO354_11455 [Verrucomicrobia bacterium]|nr:hypothetical protein [Verrucomicrobiota bacterium]
MKSHIPLAIILTVLGSLLVLADATNIAEDDASQSAYAGQWDNSKNGGTGFSAWTLTTEGNDENRHSGFYIADPKNNPDLNGIQKNDKAFGLFANGSGFEQAVAYRAFDKPLQVGDSFSFMMENGTFEKKFDKDDPTPGSIGLVLRTGNANSSVADYNKDATFEFGYYQGKANYQIYDGSDNPDSGVAFVDSGISVTVTLTGADTYDLEIQTMADKKVTKLPGRKLKSSAPIQSMAIFDRNGEKYDAYFNQFQVARENK